MAAQQSDALVARYLALRETWLPVEEGLELRIRRPAEAQLPGLRAGGADAYIACVVGWRGMTEARLLGASLGSDSPVYFTPPLWREVALDNVEWLSKVAEAVIAQVQAFLDRKDGAAKN